MMKQSGALMSSRLMPPKGRSQIADAVDECVDVRRIDFEIDGVDIGEALEEDRLAFHDRLRSQRAEIAQAEDRRAVGNHGNKIAARGVIVSGIGPFGDCANRAPPRRANRRD